MFRRSPEEVLSRLVVNTKLARHAREAGVLAELSVALCGEKTAEFAARATALSAVALPIKAAAVHSTSRSSGDAMSQGYEKDAQASLVTLTKAASVITQQQALIGELQSARDNAMKIAAALAEAASLVQDGAIGPEDVLSHARRILAHGTVKTSSLEAFDLSPGQLQGPDAEAKVGTGAQAPLPTGAQPMDPLTAFLRSAAQRQAAGL